MAVGGLVLLGLHLPSGKFGGTLGLSLFPQRGLALREHGIDPKKSWFIGDKDIDVACGRAAGCRTILVLTGYGQKHPDCGADFIVPDVTGAVRTILANDQ
jgi:D-glycero-D-manno-heptose 1,7-bisphosphate phosphatase